MESFSHPGLTHRPDLFSGSAARLLFAGDWAPVRQFCRILGEQPGGLYDDRILAAFARADYRVVNVEAVLHADPQALAPVYKEGPNLRGPVAAVADLRALGTDLGLLANNHVYDFGADGLRATADLLAEAGIATCGHGEGQEDAYDGHVVKINDVEIAFVNFQEGEEGPNTERAPEVAGWDLRRIEDSIRAHRRAGRTVIALPHADREFLPCPAPYIQKTYRALVTAGASLVIAHHPHVPRGMEIHRGCPILYSLGNFAFWQDHPGLFRKLGLLAEVAVSAEGETGLRLLPYRIGKERLRSLTEPETAWFGDHLAAVSGPALAPDRVRAAWHAAVDAIPLSSWYHDCTGMRYGMDLMEKEDPVGLARLRTRLSSPAHYEFMKAGIDRILSGSHGTSDPALVERVRLWSETAAAGPFS